MQIDDLKNLKLLREGPPTLNNIKWLYVFASTMERQAMSCGPGSRALIPDGKGKYSFTKGALHGMYFRNSNIIYVYNNGVMHNSKGPAIVVFENSKVVMQHFYFNGKKLKCDDIIVKMIKATYRE